MDAIQTDGGVSIIPGDELKAASSGQAKPIPVSAPAVPEPTPQEKTAQLRDEVGKQARPGGQTDTPTASGSLLTSDQEAQSEFAKWVHEDVAAGKLTVEQGAEALLELGLTVEQALGTFPPSEEEANYNKQWGSPNKAGDFQVSFADTSGTEAEVMESTQAAHAVLEAGEWSEAAGNSLVSTMRTAFLDVAKMTDSEREMASGRSVEFAEHIWGDRWPSMLQTARAFLQHIDSKTNGAGTAFVNANKFALDCSPLVFDGFIRQAKVWADRQTIRAKASKK
jgi:hypothetical protein